MQEKLANQITLWMDRTCLGMIRPNGEDPPLDLSYLEDPPLDLHFEDFNIFFSIFTELS